MKLVITLYDGHLFHRVKSELHVCIFYELRSESNIHIFNFMSKIKVVFITKYVYLHYIQSFQHREVNLTFEKSFKVDQITSAKRE